MNKPLLPILAVIIAAGIGLFFSFQEPHPPQESINYQSIEERVPTKPAYEEQSYRDSPFGMHGALSRPFFTDDMARIPGEIDRRTAEVKEPYKHIQDIGIRNGYQNTEIWFTETAVPSRPFGERFQAINLVKRYVYSLSCGAKKVFWWNLIEGEGPLLAEEKPSNHFGLIYDGIGEGDPGYGTRKLSYYTYKKMVEVLEGSDWNNIQIIMEKDGIYIYKFMKNGKPIWVAWNDNSGLNPS